MASAVARRARLPRAVPRLGDTPTYVYVRLRTTYVYVRLRTAYACVRLRATLRTYVTTYVRTYRGSPGPRWRGSRWGQTAKTGCEAHSQDPDSEARGRARRRSGSGTEEWKPLSLRVGEKDTQERADLQPYVPPAAVAREAGRARVGGAGREQAAPGRGGAYWRLWRAVAARAAGLGAAAVGAGQPRAARVGTACSRAQRGGAGRANSGFVGESRRRKNTYKASWLPCIPGDLGGFFLTGVDSHRPPKSKTNAWGVEKSGGRPECRRGSKPKWQSGLSGTRKKSSPALDITCFRNRPPTFPRAYVASVGLPDGGSRASRRARTAEKSSSRGGGLWLSTPVRKYPLRADDDDPDQKNNKSMMKGQLEQEERSGRMRSCPKKRRTAGAPRWEWRGVARRPGCGMAH